MMLFAKAQIIGGIVPNLIAFVLFLGAIGCFGSTGKMSEMLGWKKKEINFIPERGLEAMLQRTMENLKALEG